jgi:hypothetical protein
MIVMVHRQYAVEYSFCEERFYKLLRVWAINRSCIMVMGKKSEAKKSNNYGRYNADGKVHAPTFRILPLDYAGVPDGLSSRLSDH